MNAPLECRVHHRRRRDHFAFDAAELRALLGRRPGSVVMATLRNGWPFTIRVLDAAPATEKETT